MYNITSEQHSRAAEAQAGSTGARLIMLFDQPHLSAALKMDAAYRIIRETAPELGTAAYLIHAKILIDAARKAIEEREDRERAARTPTAADMIRAMFPAAVEIHDGPTPDPNGNTAGERRRKKQCHATPAQTAPDAARN